MSLQRIDRVQSELGSSGAVVLHPVRSGDQIPLRGIIWGETDGSPRHTLAWWAAPLGLVLISIGIGVLESPPVRLLPWIAAVLILAFAAQSFGQHVGGAVLGSFLR